jgi:preprotein translocase subunit SecG
VRTNLSPRWGLPVAHCTHGLRACEKCLLQLEHRVPGLTPDPFFIELRYALKAHTDTNREFFRKACAVGCILLHSCGRFAVKTDSHRSLDGCGKATLVGVRLASGGNAGVMMRVMAVLLVVMFVMVMTLSCQ